MYFAGNGPGAMKKNGKLSTKEMIHPWYGTDHLGVDDISNMLVPAPACNTNACSSMPPLEPDSPVNMQECRGQGVAATRPQHNARCAVQQQCCTMHWHAATMLHHAPTVIQSEIAGASSRASAGRSST